MSKHHTGNADNDQLAGGLNAPLASLQSEKPPPRHLKWATALALLAGVVLFAYLLKRYDPSEVLLAFSAAGWGILWVSAYRLVPLTMDAAGWRELCPAWAKSRFLLLVLFRWIGEAVNTLIPAAQVGGGIVRTRLLGRVGQDFVSAGASTVVDFTVGIFVQAVYTALGIVLLLRAAPLRSVGLRNASFAAIAIMIVAMVVLFAWQRRGMFQKLAAGSQRALAGSFPFITSQHHESAKALDSAVSDLYSNSSAMLRCAAWRIAAAILRTGETWLAMYFLGAQVSWGEALILESLGSAIRSAVFFVPAGLGAQEGGFLLIGSALGLAPPLSLALSLVKRAREILVGSPGLIAWVLAER